jgi:predicted DNA-binding antitoxin AbrB/MazE fold protein
MSVIHAIFENGVFKPTQPVNLPDKTPVCFEVQVIEQEAKQVQAMPGIHEVMSRRFRSGRRDLAERHNEHQP